MAIHKDLGADADLVRKIFSKGTGSRNGIVALADPRQHQQAAVVEGPRSEDYYAGRLIKLRARGIGVSHAARFAIAMVDATHGAPRPQCEITAFCQHRQQRVAGLRFGADHATVASAVTAVGAT